MRIIIDGIERVSGVPGERFSTQVLNPLTVSKRNMKGMSPRGNSGRSDDLSCSQFLFDLGRYFFHRFLEIDSANSI